MYLLNTATGPFRIHDCSEWIKCNGCHPFGYYPKTEHIHGHAILASIQVFALLFFKKNLGLNRLYCHISIPEGSGPKNIN